MIIVGAELEYISNGCDRPVVVCDSFRFKTHGFNLGRGASYASDSTWKCNLLVPSQGTVSFSSRYVAQRWNSDKMHMIVYVLTPRVMVF